MKFTKVIFIFLICTIPVIGQTNVEIIEEEQLWLGYFNQTRVSDKWGIWFDGHFRTKDYFVGEPSKILIRPGITYYVNNNLKLTNGYTFVNHFPELGHKNISQQEHRIWQQMQYHSFLGKIRLMQWVRLEERFRHKIKNDDELAPGHQFDLRLRSNFLFNFPFSKKGIVPKTFSGILNDEIFINFRNPNNPTYFPFDQNRFFIGLSYNISNHSNLQFGYMNVYQQLTAGTKFRSTDAIRVFYFQNLDLRKK